MGHQHLLGAVTGAFVHLLQEAQCGGCLELAFVIDVADIDYLACQCDGARYLVGDRRFSLEGMNGLDLGNDRGLVFAME